MVRIADHHRWKDKDFVPSCEWPEQCYVQWGSSGVVISRDGNHYRTAFFEAFPGDNAGGFIRGEGTTLADAEADAFGKYQKEVSCSHRWGRGKYTNGGALCHACGAFQTRFKPVVILGEWRRPLNRWERMLLRDVEEDNEPAEQETPYMRRLRIRMRLYGVEPSHQGEVI